MLTHLSVQEEEAHTCDNSEQLALIVLRHSAREHRQHALHWRVQQLCCSSISTHAGPVRSKYSISSYRCVINDLT